MKKIFVLVVGLVLSNTAMAGSSSYLDVGYITGGENGENGPGDENGGEIAGSFAFGEKWYVGGVIGSYDRDAIDTTNDYIYINGGAAWGLTERTDLITELGVWTGEQDSGGVKTDPNALELKFGVNSQIAEKFGLFATISLVRGDLDTPTDSDLSNFVWSAGGAFNFTENLSASLKIVDGSNGVNGQSEVARIGLRWTF
jgi:hypothetical protein